MRGGQFDGNVQDRVVIAVIIPLLQMEITRKQIDTLAQVAAEWRDPAHPPRAAARQKTLEAPNQWTDQALTHAMNRWMQRLTVEGMTEWLGNEKPSPPLHVGVLHPETSPLAGIRDALAAWVLGDRYVGHVPASSPAILPAFAEELAEHDTDFSIQFGDREEIFEQADVLIAQPSESPDSIHDTCDEHEIPPEHRLIRTPVYSVGVVDGNESDDEMERLAEDMFLFEGMGRRRLAVLWAPEGHSPDAYLQAMARFRGLFPAHEDTPGTLQMQQAFLEARDEPHAYAEGLEFLVSRGEPEPQRPGHVRWAEYDSLESLEDWIDGHQRELYSVIARSDLQDQLSSDPSVRTPGGVHVPPLNDPEGREVVSFLKQGRR